MVALCQQGIVIGQLWTHSLTDNIYIRIVLQYGINKLYTKIYHILADMLDPTLILDAKIKNRQRFKENV